MTPALRQAVTVSPWRRFNPALVVDITNGGLVEQVRGAAIAFTRASTAWAFDSAGAVRAYGTNEPRIVPSPAGVMSLLREVASTNLLTESEFRNGLADVTTGANVSVAVMSGFAGAIRFDNAGATSPFVYKSGFSATASTQYTISVVVEMDDGLPPVFGSSLVNNPANDFYFNIGGSVALSPTTYTVQRLGSSNRYRVSGTGNSDTTNLIRNGVIKNTGNSARPFKATALMMEQQATVTSYIPTTTGQVTRATEVITVPYARTVGALYLDFSFATTTALTDTILSVDDGSSSNRTQISRSSTNTARMSVISGGVTGMDQTNGALPNGSRNRIALRVALNDSKAAINGALQTADTLVTPSVGTTTLRLGFNPSNNGATSMFIHGVRAYTTALTDAQLQAITSP